MNWLDFVLLVLATYRLTALIVYESGPFDLVMRFRSLIYEYFDEDHWLVRGANCPYCVSFWLASLSLLVSFNWLLWLGVAGGTMLLFVLLGADDHATT